MHATGLVSDFGFATVSLIRRKDFTVEQQRAIADQAFGIRRLCLEFITNAGWGHIGGSFSEAELLAALYSGILRIDPAAPDELFRDRFILSKAHASPALYAALALSGFFQTGRLARSRCHRRWFCELCRDDPECISGG